VPTNANGKPVGRPSSAPGGAVGTPSASTSTDPETGQQVGAQGSATAGALPAAVPVALQTRSNANGWVLPTLTALDIVAAIVVPGIVLSRLRRRRAANE
jgi:hypothetical protein